jgi:rhodanese-related sulfurtransferase/biotin operon repressor
VSRQSPKILIFEQFARIGQALASGPRLELLELIAQYERSVDALARLSGLSVANTSRHLQQLRQAGLVVGRKDGQFVFYRLAGDEVVGLLSALWQLGEARSAEIERLIATYLLDKDALEAVSFDELRERARKGLVTILDVRPRDEYEAGHLPGALCMPVPELLQRIGELPRRKEVIAYCRGPYCVMSFEAVALLRKQGRKARRLADGLPQWRASGLPVERG